MSCSRSNDSKLFHFKYKGRVVGMHLLLLFIEGLGGMDKLGKLCGERGGEERER